MALSNNIVPPTTYRYIFTSKRSLKNGSSKERPSQSAKNGFLILPCGRLNTAQSEKIAHKTVPPATAYIVDR